jgi:hypothetical protein
MNFGAYMGKIQTKPRRPSLDSAVASNAGRTGRHDAIDERKELS